MARVEAYISCKNVKGICPKCGQPACLIQSLDDGEYFWDHDNPRDLYIHGGMAFGNRERVSVENEEARRLIRLSNNGKRGLIEHSWKVRCVQTGEVYRSSREASEATGTNASALGRALKSGCHAGGYFWCYAEYTWRDLEEPKPRIPNRYYGPSFMMEHDVVADPVDLGRKGCPECGSHYVRIDGRTMLPALMAARGMTIARKLEGLTGVDRTCIGRLKKWHGSRPAKEMEAAKTIAAEFGVTVEFLLALDPRDCWINPFWEAPPSHLICHDCHYEAPWETWKSEVENRYDNG